MKHSGKHAGRQHLIHAGISLALVAGLLGTGVPAPAAAADSSGLGGLLGTLFGGGTSSPLPQASTISGRLDMPSQRLRRGCKKYTYHYRLQIPDGLEFDLEIFVTDPRGVSQASDVILSGADPLEGAKNVTICRSNTQPGRFLVHGELYTNDGQGPTTETKVPDEPFRLWVHHTKQRHTKRHHRA